MLALILSLAFAGSPTIERLPDVKITFSAPEWSRETTPRVRAIATVSDGTGWAVGEHGLIARIEGEAWTIAEASGIVPADLHTISLAKSGDGWAIGSGGTLLRVKSGQWLIDPQHQELVPSEDELIALLVSASGLTAWAASKNRLWHWTEASQRWQRQKLPEFLAHITLLTLDADGRVLLNSGQRDWACRPARECEAQTLKALALAPAGDSIYWAARGGEIWKLVAGQRQNVDQANRGGSIHQIVMHDPPGARISGWAFGARGLILSLDGSQWSEHPDSGVVTHSQLKASALDDRGAGWAVDDQGRVLRLSVEGRWQPRSPLPGLTLHGNSRGIDVEDDGTAWLATDHQLIVRRGEDWHVVDRDLDEQLAPISINALAVSLDRRHGWAGGVGTILRLSDGKWYVDPELTALLGGRNVAFIGIDDDGEHAVLVGRDFILDYGPGGWREVAAANPIRFGEEEICNYDSRRGALLLRSGNAFIWMDRSGERVPGFTVPLEVGKATCRTTTTDGALYVMTDEGVARKEGEKWKVWIRKQAYYYTGQKASGLSGAANLAAYFEAAGMLVLFDLKTGQRLPQPANCTFRPQDHQISNDTINGSAIHFDQRGRGHVMRYASIAIFDRESCVEVDRSNAIAAEEVLIAMAVTDGDWVGTRLSRKRCGDDFCPSRGTLLRLVEDELRIARPLVWPTAVLVHSGEVLIVGRGGLMVTAGRGPYRSQQIRLDDSDEPASTSEEVEPTALAYGGGREWIAGRKGLIARLDAGKWTKIRSTSDADLHGIAIDPSGRGWAVGDDSTVLRIAGDTANIVDAGITPVTLRDVAVDLKSNGWIVGNGGTMLRIEGDRVTPETKASVDLTAVALADDGSGWIVGDSGTILHVDGDRVVEDRRASKNVEDSFIDAAVTSDARLGWAAARRAVLRAKPRDFAASLENISVEFTEEDEGTVAANFSFALLAPPEFSEVTARVLDKQGESLAEGLNIKIDETRHASFTVTRLRPQQTITAEVTLSDPERTYLSFPITLRSVSTPGYYAIQWIFYIVGFWLALQIALVLAAPWSRMARGVVTDPKWPILFNIFFFKYVIIDWLISSIRPIRLRLFDRYRQQVVQADWLSGWNQKKYTPMEIQMGDSGVKVSHIEALSRLLAARPGRLNFITGPSGAGKSALLEQWTRMAIAEGYVVFLIRLGGPQDATSIISAQVLAHGELHLSADMLSRMLRGGGFVLLFDAYNEDNGSESTLKLLGESVNKNTIIVSTQVKPPRWHEQLLPSQEHKIMTLSDQQLEDMLPEGVLSDLKGRNELAALLEDVRLPNHAHLLIEYYQECKRLPYYRVQLFENLWWQLAADAERGRFVEQIGLLMQSAWDLVSSKESNKYDFAPSPEKVRRETCELAVARGVLTRDGDRYVFRHRSILWYFIARHLRMASPWKSMNREWFARYHEQIDPWIRMRGEERELFGFFFEWCASDEPEMVPHLIGELVGFSRDRALSIFDTSLKYRISWFLELHPDAEARMGKLGWLAP